MPVVQRTSKKLWLPSEQDRERLDQERSVFTASVYSCGRTQLTFWTSKGSGGVAAASKLRRLHGRPRTRMSLMLYWMLMTRQLRLTSRPWNARARRRKSQQA